jgi:hypothetical protein
VENTASNSSSIVACVSVTGVTWFGSRGKVFTEPLLNNGHHLLSCYSGFQQTCHNMLNFMDSEVLISDWRTLGRTRKLFRRSTAVVVHEVHAIIHLSLIKGSTHHIALFAFSVKVKINVIYKIRLYLRGVFTAMAGNELLPAVKKLSAWRRKQKCLCDVNLIVIKTFESEGCPMSIWRSNKTKNYITLWFDPEILWMRIIRFTEVIVIVVTFISR